MRRDGAQTGVSRTRAARRVRATVAGSAVRNPFTDQPRAVPPSGFRRSGRIWKELAERLSVSAAGAAVGERSALLQAPRSLPRHPAGKDRVPLLLAAVAGDPPSDAAAPWTLAPLARVRVHVLAAPTGVCGGSRRGTRARRAQSASSRDGAGGSRAADGLSGDDARGSRALCLRDSGSLDNAGRLGPVEVIEVAGAVAVVGIETFPVVEIPRSSSGVPASLVCAAGER